MLSLRPEEWNGQGEHPRIGVLEVPLRGIPITETEREVGVPLISYCEFMGKFCPLHARDCFSELRARLDREPVELILLEWRGGGWLELSGLADQRIGRAVEQRVESRLGRLPFLLCDDKAVDEIAVFHLRPHHIGLRGLTDGVPGLGRSQDPLMELKLFFGDLDIPIRHEQLVIALFHRSDDLSLLCLVAGHRHGLFLGSHLPA